MDDFSFREDPITRTSAEEKEGPNPDDLDEEKATNEEIQQIGPEEIGETQDFLKGEPLVGPAEEYFSSIVEILEKYNKILNEQNAENYTNNSKYLADISLRLASLSDYLEKFNLLSENREKIKGALGKVGELLQLITAMGQDWRMFVEEMKKAHHHDEVEEELRLSLHNRISNDNEKLLLGAGGLMKSTDTLDYLLGHLQTLYPKEGSVEKRLFRADWHDFDDSLKITAERSLELYRDYLNLIVGLKLLIQDRKRVVESNGGNVAYGDNVYRETDRIPSYFPTEVVGLFKAMDVQISDDEQGE